MNACRHEESLWGRCVACGLTWGQQAQKRAAIRIVRAVETCTACPSQWDAWTSTGDYLHLRFRYGRGTVRAKSTGGPIVAEFTHGDDMAGSISLIEFCQLAGIALAEGVTT